MKRGEVYLVNFGKKYNSEFGKVRPAVIVQNDTANRNIDKVIFKGVTLLPMTTTISGGDIRVMIPARGKLQRNSEVCINEICTLDKSRITIAECLTTLTEEEMNEINTKMLWHLNLNITR